MTLKGDLQARREGWEAVEKIQEEERRTAALESRWRQLNAAYAMAKGLGLFKPDPSAMEVK